MEKNNKSNVNPVPEPSKKKEYEPGSLATFRKMTNEEYEIFIKQLSDNVSYKLDMLRNALDNDLLFLKILDEFAGESINFPNRKQSFQYLDRTFMYTYAKKRGFTEEAYNSVAKHFGEKLAVVKNKVLRISQLLDGAEYKTLVKAQEKLRAQRKAKREENRRKRELEELQKRDESSDEEV